MSGQDQELSLLCEGTDYQLLAAPDQATFLLRFKPDRLAARLTGEDAERFRIDHEAVKLQLPTAAPDRILAQLWDQGGYSWLATEEGG